MDNTAINLVIESLPLLFRGLLKTLEIAIYSIILSTIFGLLFGIIRTSKNKFIIFISRFYIELFRVIPIIVWLFLAFFGLPIAFNISISNTFASTLIFTLWGITEVGEVVRGALESIPKIQIESGKALGLSNYDLYRYVIIPQGLRRMIPSTINVYTRIIKTTSLAVLIGVTEVIKVGQQIIERTKEALIIYTCLFIIYFLLCYPLSVFSRNLEKKLCDS
ncbi:amino acid ABC transporter permease [Clostridium hydrogeniformans]|uniref:amino acid ABC transporter permease n=1 Tax=Clostridium hydrogeniformans TaxID=349933 RepID=UPI00048485CB|nr:amino acid ABC transporter permease [Clostridium hydrogeniformans]